MYFSSLITSLALMACLSASARGATIVGYGSTSCDGSVGDTVQCDGSCHSFTDRHSLKVSTFSLKAIKFKLLTLAEVETTVSHSMNSRLACMRLRKCGMPLLPQTNVITLTLGDPSNRSNAHLLLFASLELLDKLGWLVSPLGSVWTGIIHYYT
ncbi:hypothetical protein CVT25_008933 [Psilocybe cyanescens]|uniref:Uncharacterized protein n=1 Tax=Psilocybe cyanescens TaxID=93625 RepID=A0A409XNE3_PSICY|nr:hypothetical protein CVT25_008933 [Psilocybe cyanescens]